MGAKVKLYFTCTSCGSSTPKWAGSCPSCSEWNTLVQEQTSAITSTITSAQAKETTSLGSKNNERIVRVPVGIPEFDRVLGGGIVPGSLILLGGDPGIGKSTLILQSAASIATINQVLYVSGEESISQILLRGERLGLAQENTQLLAETNIETILATAKKLKPIALIIDSIQTISSTSIPSSSGSVSQVRHCTELLLNFSNETGIATIIIGHVTKEGSLAGPRTLEHLVDTVLYLEGDRYDDLRLLRGVKNRFGSTGEIGIFQMESEGLIEVQNTSESFVTQNNKGVYGTALTVVMEGMRPFLVEVQALTTKTNFANPKRNANGFDLNRLQLLIAILSKHTSINLDNQDVYINVVGGMKISERSADLAVLSALASSHTKKPLDRETVFISEVGLTGELRQVTSLDKRIQELESLGVKKAIIPDHKKTKAKKATLQKCSFIAEVINMIKK